MFYCPEGYKKPELRSMNDILAEELHGELDDTEAKISLAKYLRHNIGITTELIAGIKMAPYQEIHLKAFLNRNFNMCVWGRGCGKSFVAALFCFLYSIFEYKKKILIASANFRTARRIFENLERIVDSKGGALLAQCMGRKFKRTDINEWSVNEGTIQAIPLGGEKIRGFRADVLILDEFLLLPKEIVETVLMPFLVATPEDQIPIRMRISDKEDRLIAAGKMTKEEKTIFPNVSKMICLSSASYTFEYLFEKYKEWMERIRDVDKPKDQKMFVSELDDRDKSDLDTVKSTYFVSKMGWDSIPEYLLDDSIIKEAESGGTSHAAFQREYCANFVDESDNYYSMKKMNACTIPDGVHPTTEVVGDPNDKYILAIDPNASNSPTADFFAMGVLKVDEYNKETTLVHNYAVAGGDQKDHIEYAHYLLTHFNIMLTVCDSMGYEFIESCHESSLFKDSGLNWRFLDFDGGKEDADYVKQLKTFKKQYNATDGRTAIKQIFSSGWIARANELLQANIDHKRIWFSSRVSANGDYYVKKATHTKLPSFLYKTYKNTGEFMEHQDDMIEQVKKQCALVSVKTTPRGTLTFDLPIELKRSTHESRARKDNYSALLLGNWAMKIWSDVHSPKIKTRNYSGPKIIR
jgi:hypothetical protein